MFARTWNSSLIYILKKHLHFCYSFYCFYHIIDCLFIQLEGSSMLSDSITNFHRKIFAIKTASTITWFISYKSISRENNSQVLASLTSFSIHFASTCKFHKFFNTFRKYLQVLASFTSFSIHFASTCKFHKFFHTFHKYLQVFHTNLQVFACFVFIMHINLSIYSRMNK